MSSTSACMRWCKQGEPDDPLCLSRKKKRPGSLPSSVNCAGEVDSPRSGMLLTPSPSEQPRGPPPRMSTFATCQSVTNLINI
ncbi:unnamed protein product [Boreogadus saida]